MPGVDVMAFGAHPDDVEICVGGTLIRMADAGRSVVIVDMVRGEMGTRGTTDMRAAEAAAAAAIIGAAARENLSLPDGSVQPNDEARRRVAEVVRRHRPSVVLLPYHEGRHPDHFHTGEAVYEGVFVAGLQRYDTGQEPHRPSRLLYYPTAVPFQPSLNVDVSAQVERKLEAIYAYSSQFSPDPGLPATPLTAPGFRHALLSRMGYWGSLIRKQYGEAYVIRGMLEVTDLMDLDFSSF